MRRAYYLLTVLAMVLASCSDNELATNGTDYMRAEVKAFSSFNVSTEDTPMTRVQIEDGARMAWEEGDVIGVYSDMQDVVSFTYAGNNTFTSEKEVKGTVFYAYYPYNSDHSAEFMRNYVDANDKHVVHFFLEDNLYLAGLEQPNRQVFPLVAMSEDNHLMFKQTVGLLHFTLEGKQHISHLGLRSEGSNPYITGNMKVDLSEESPVMVVDTENWSGRSLGRSIMMGCDFEVSDNETLDVYFPIPIGTYTDGFVFQAGYEDENGDTQYFDKYITHAVEIKRGSKSSLPALSVADYPTLVEETRLRQVENQKVIERESLIALYNATGGDNWTNNTNWLSDKPMGEWYGITVDERGTVVSVDLYENILSGNIPESISNLTNLWGLDLSGNQLTGTIPESISNLTNLGYLYLSGNQLTGTIPESISNLTNLEYLDLSGNQLTGSIPESISNLTNLEYLNLYNNQLTGSIPESISNLTNLEHLSLGFNQLTGSIPESISNLTNLGGLYLFGNHLTGTIPEAFANITRSNFYLSIHHNDMDGVISTSIQESAWWSNYIDITQNEGHKLTLESKESDSHSGSIEGFDSKEHDWEGTSGGIYEDTDPENAGGGEGE